MVVGFEERFEDIGRPDVGGWECGLRVVVDVTGET